MTTVLIKKTLGGYKGFTCTGHAGYAESGSDIVCSAVSVLVINTINAMEAFAKEQMEVITGEEDGVIDVTFVNPVNEKTKLLMDTMVLGLESIEKQYRKKYLRLKFEEV
ncbi:MAG: ribosomal-processing cysteine protease Prp [Lachnospiraceae bacterium]|nr:ribosomal-processing cysteine protease Prp [Lachnospiraceae bacterium]